MTDEKTPVTTHDEYFAQFPEEIREILNKIRAIIREVAPEAKEKIGYQMPGFALNGDLAYFAVHKNHIGFYPMPEGIAAFKDELSGYKMAKGSVQFPLDRPVPYDLMRRIVAYRTEQNRNKKKKGR